MEFKPERVLDVGSGDAMLWRGYGYIGKHNLADPRIEPWKLPFNCKIVLLDLDVYRHPLDFVHGNALYLPFRDRSFEFVIATEIIEHVPNPVLLAEEVRRVGERYLLTTPVCEDPQLRYPYGDEMFFKNPWLINLVKAYADQTYPHHSHLQIFTEEELARMFPEAEISVEENAEGMRFFVVKK